MEHHEIRDRMLKNCDEVLIPKMKPSKIKEFYGIPCFSKSQDEFIDRYQKGCRTDSLMKRINGTEKSYFNLSKKARNYLLSDKAHKISPSCCKYLKKEPAKEYEKRSGRKPILGVRSAESRLRGAKYKTCLTKTGRFTPLHDLSDDLLNRIYEVYEIEVPEVYNHVCRTGCMGCPYGTYKGDTQKELTLINKKQRKFVIEYFKESYEILGIDFEEDS